MHNNLTADVTIVGAGLNGITLACSLAQNGVSVIVLESGDLSLINNKESDGRTSALSSRSVEIFQEISAWDNMKNHAGAILDIRVTDGNSPLFLHYDHSMVGDNPMGYIVENFYIRSALFILAEKSSNISILDKSSYEKIEYFDSKAEITLSNKTKITSSLIIGADGRNSSIRKNAGIKATEWPYHQSGIVFTVKHEKTHNGVAYERFLPAGPFAILPMADSYHSSIVWTEKSHLAPLFMKMQDAEFLEQLYIRFGHHLGKLEVVSKRFAYPLELVYANKYTANRLALIGDAAHAMHPIAGQGFNLGLRDIPVLTKLISEAKKLGQDVGSEQILLQYEEQRKFDNVSLLAITDLLTRLFSNDIMPIKTARRIGLAAVNKMPSLKKVFIKHAMGKTRYL